MSFVLLGILNSQAAGAGGAGTYDLLETTVLTSSASSVSFTGLDSYTDYKHLQLRLVMQNAGTNENNLNDFLTFNSDSGANYATHWLNGNGSSVSSFSSTDDNQITLRESSATDAGGSVFNATIIDILDFASANKNTTVRALVGGVGVNEQDIILQSGLYNSTNSITQIDLTNSASLDYQVGSRFSLYGIKG